MPTIHINVKNRVATQIDGTVIINGNSDYNIEFNFDAEWADLNNKIGIFAYNDAAAHKWAYQTVMFSGNTCAVPILRDIHCVYVGVTAGNVRVTTPAKVQCRLSISDYADTEEPPSADIWGQILAKLDELQTEIDEIKAGGVGGTPDWAQNDPNGAGYIKNRCGGYDDVQTIESKLLSLNCPADLNTVGTLAPPSFFPPSAGDIISVTVDGSAKEYTLAEGTVNGESFLWFGTQNPSSVTDVDAFFASDKWFGGFKIDESNMSVVVNYGSLSEIVGKTIGLKQRRLSVIPVKINRRYLDVPDWAKADSKPTYTASDVGAVPTDSVTTAVNAESTNENVPTAKAVYDALQDIGIPSGTDISLNVTGATVGQTIKVKAVDADGKPTAWEAVDIAAGDTWELLGTLDASTAEVLQLDFPYPVKKLYFSSALTDSAGEAYSASDKVYRQVAFNVDGTWRDVNGFKIGCCKFPYGWNTRYWLECGADLPTAKGEWASTLSGGSAQLQLTPFHISTGNNYTKGPISGIRFSLTLSAAAENTASGSIEVWGVKA